MRIYYFHQKTTLGNPKWNITPFGEEKDMSVPDWHKAKANYKIFLSEAFADEVAGSMDQTPQILSQN